MRHIKSLYGIKFSILIAASACVAGCSLEDPCEPNETLSEDGRCIPIPVEPNDCGRSHYNCMSYGVKSAVCEVRNDAADSQAAYRCVVSECESGFHKSKNSEASVLDVMQEVCLPDSVQECGESKQNCTAVEGVSIAACKSGICEPSACQVGYILTNRVCVKESARACGAEDNSKVDCIDGWLPEIYHNNKTWMAASIPGCTANQCVISSCQNLTDESNQTEIRFVKKSCSDVIDIAEAYKAAYLDLHHTAIELPDCMDDNEKPKTIDACIEDLCPDDDAKFMPGVCGCGVFEDIADDDGDGVINCLDACPRNSSKSVDIGNGGCDVNDSDHDGVDDIGDVCPTRDNVKTVEQLNMDTLRSMSLLGADGQPDVEKIRALTTEERAQMCGIFVPKEFGDVDGFHIYNAKDLDYLRILSRDIVQNETCENGTDSCRNNIRTNCVDGFKRTYDCNKCSTSHSIVSCTDAAENAVEPNEMHKYLHIVLENDININDGVDSLFYTNGDCIALWTPIPYIWNMEFDGGNHTIQYTNPRLRNDSLRCNLTDAFIDSIRFSDVHDLTIDFNMRGNGHGVFANSIVGSSLSHIVINSSSLETSVTDDLGVGILAGSFDNETVNTNFELTADLSDIRFGNRDGLRVVAEYADNVGGVIGCMTEDSSIDAAMFVQTLSVGEIIGKNRVGGMLGTGRLVQTTPLTVEVGSVHGVNYVGGLIGYGKYTQQNTLNLSVLDVKGNDYIGGAFGYLEYGNMLCSDNGQPVIVNRVYRVSGNNKVGGLVGHVKAIKKCDAGYSVYLKNSADFIDADGNNVGGVFGHLDGGRISADNYVRRIRGGMNIGGIVGDAERRDTSNERLMISKSVNVVDMIVASGNRGGGVLGYCLTYGSLVLKDIYNYVKNIDLKIDVDEFGGVVGHISIEKCKTSTIEHVFNVVDDVRLGYSAHFSGLVGTFSYLITSSPELADTASIINGVSSYVKSVNAGSESSSKNIAGLFGMLTITRGSKIQHSDISNVSSYVNCSEANCTGGFVQAYSVQNNEFMLGIHHSSMGAVNQDEQCYNVITSDKYSDRVEFENTYWFSPDSEHYAPFGKDVSFDASKLTAFGDNANEISEVADSIKVWEPATEQIELGGKSFELPVVFTKNQFLQETGLTYDQSRYTDFDNWCRRVEQEHPELLIKD